MEINIIVICMTLIIITFFIYMLFKDKNARGHIEYDTKTGKLLLKKLTNNVNSEVDIDKKVEEYKKFKPDSRIETLNIYKEFLTIVNISTVKIYTDVLGWVFTNGISEFTDYQIAEYSRNKIIYIRNLYNKMFLESKNEFLKELNLKLILGSLSVLLQNEINLFYNTVYKNHRQYKEKKSSLIRNLTNVNESKAEKLLEFTETVNNYYNEMLSIDCNLLKESLENYNNVLIGTFHDKLLDFINKK